MSAFIPTTNSGFLVLTEFYDGYTVLIPINIISSVNAHCKGGSIINGIHRLHHYDKRKRFHVKEPPGVIAKLLSTGKE